MCHSLLLLLRRDGLAGQAARVRILGLGDGESAILFVEHEVADGDRIWDIFLTELRNAGRGIEHHVVGHWGGGSGEGRGMRTVWMARPRYTAKYTAINNGNSGSWNLVVDTHVRARDKGLRRKLGGR